MKPTQGLCLRRLLVHSETLSNQILHVLVNPLLPLLGDGDFRGGWSWQENPLCQKLTPLLSHSWRWARFLNVDIVGRPPPPSPVASNTWRRIGVAELSAHRPLLLTAELCKFKALGWSRWGSWFNIWSKHKVLETSAGWKPSILKLSSKTSPPLCPNFLRDSYSYPHSTRCFQRFLRASDGCFSWVLKGLHADLWGCWCSGQVCCLLSFSSAQMTLATTNLFRGLNEGSRTVIKVWGGIQDLRDTQCNSDISCFATFHCEKGQDGGVPVRTGVMSPRIEELGAVPVFGMSRNSCFN